MNPKPSVRDARRFWPDVAAVRRWHFYAGLFCLPFFAWLAVTGSIYLFRPDIEDWLDRPYENLALGGPRPTPSAEARAAVDALPGASFSHYEPPATPTGAAQVVVRQGGVFQRVVVDPRTLRPMHVVQDDHRPMDLVAHLHGQLLLGTQGSTVVEIAGCWGVVMILTGLFLWWPRGPFRLAGTFYPRLGGSRQRLWRDLHAVAGVWISGVTLLLLLSGLPWSSTWGNYLNWARDHWAATRGAPDWPIGGAEPLAPTTPKVESTHVDAMPGMSAAEMAAMSGAPSRAASTPDGAALPFDLGPLDRLVPLAATLGPLRPVWISPPAPSSRDWSISSHVQNRPLRVTYTVDPDRGAVTGKQGFGDLNIVDRVVNFAIATHEGQLFGRLNQAILLLNALALLVLVASAFAMWWRRRPSGVLGAPKVPLESSHLLPLAAAILALAVVLPLFGLSLLLVLAVEKTLLRRIPSVRVWLGLGQESRRSEVL